LSNATWAWLLKWRRLRCDYERQPANSETLILIAMIGLMSRRPRGKIFVRWERYGMKTTLAYGDTVVTGAGLTL